jgi:RHS repeat-associated protein
LSNAGSVAAHYEYTPFGDAFVASGAYASMNEYRFSTKPLDAASGLYYYGFRYYNPSTGRWPSRDPISESGGLHLYGYVNNDPINWVDSLGCQSVSITSPASAAYLAEIGMGDLAVSAAATGAATTAAVDAADGKLDGQIGPTSNDTRAHGQGELVSTVVAGDIGVPIPDPKTGIPAGWVPDPANPGYYKNPNGRGTAKPDLNHGPPYGPHTDVWPGNGEAWRAYPDGTVTPKNSSAEKKKKIEDAKKPCP